MESIRIFDLEFSDFFVQFFESFGKLSKLKYLGINHELKNSMDVLTDNIGKLKLLEKIEFLHPISTLKFNSLCEKLTKGQTRICSNLDMFYPKNITQPEFLQSINTRDMNIPFLSSMSGDYNFDVVSEMHFFTSKFESYSKEINSAFFGNFKNLKTLNVKLEGSKTNDWDIMIFLFQNNSIEDFSLNIKRPINDFKSFRILFLGANFRKLTITAGYSMSGQISEFLISLSKAPFWNELMELQLLDFRPQDIISVLKFVKMMQFAYFES